MLRGKIMGFSLYPLPLVLLTGHHHEEHGSIIFAPSIQVFICTDEMPLSFLLSKLNRHSSSSLSSQEGCSNLFISFEVLFWTLYQVHVSCTVEHISGHSTPSVATTMLRRVERSPPSDLLEILCLMQPGIPLAFFAARTHSWLIFYRVHMQ